MSRAFDSCHGHGHQTNAQPCLIHTQDVYEKFPAFALATLTECVLEAGELLFVPAGSPHTVLNLTKTLALSGKSYTHVLPPPGGLKCFAAAIALAPYT